MKKLSRGIFRHINKSFPSYARNLEQQWFEYEFGGGSEGAVLKELAQFQNSDGGFGKGLEADFNFPDSSPMGTSKAFQIISALNPKEVPVSLIQKAIGYLESTFDTERKGWYTVGERVNDYPHAPWWHYKKEIHGTAIDGSWGNPTAELTGYLWQYSEFVKSLDPLELVQNATDYLMDRQEFSSFHEIFSFLRMNEKLPPKMNGDLSIRLAEIVQEQVSTNPEEWSTYVAFPYFYMDANPTLLLGLDADLVANNLDYLVARLEKDQMMIPEWEWGQYPEDWIIAKKAWQGIQTLKVLRILKRYGRIEGIKEAF